ncbi:MAG: DUF1934 domain-containing protein [Oscillospiraceae bacterium]|jgi:uncharacterized beta-barrel protein YwiB (DUF1934 family)|nr:DUF1934 domain-containing protein [Oscillospiraceae bacterium]
MRRRNVWISIKGRQLLGLYDDCVEMATGGFLSPVPGGYMLSYLESSKYLGQINTKLVVLKDKMTLTREGEQCTHMEFEQGQKLLSYFDNESGSYTVGVNTLRLTSTLGDGGGDVEMRYSIELDNEMTGASVLSIHVTPDTQACGDAAPSLSESPGDRFYH